MNGLMTTSIHEKLKSKSCTTNTVNIVVWNSYQPTAMMAFVAKNALKMPGSSVILYDTIVFDL